MAKISVPLEKPREEIDKASQVVVPLFHVESVLNKVIPDLEKVLHLIQGWDQPDGSKLSITKGDIEKAVSVMKNRLVSELR